MNIFYSIAEESEVNTFIQSGKEKRILLQGRF